MGISSTLWWLLFVVTVTITSQRINSCEGAVSSGLKCSRNPARTISIWGKAKVSSSLSLSSNYCLWELRGGDSDYDYDESETENDVSGNDDEGEESSPAALMEGGISAFKLLGKVTLAIFNALNRAIDAGISTLQSDDGGGDEEDGLAKKIVSVFINMLSAAFDTSYTNSGSSSTISSDNSMDEEDDSSILLGDIRTQLYGQYKINNHNDEEEESKLSKIHHNPSFRDMLKVARAQARLLVVFIPNDKNGKQLQRNSLNQIGMTSLLSNQVSSIAEQTSRRTKKRQSSTFGSYLLYTSTIMSPSKFMKLCKGIQKPTNPKSPLLLVIYPAQVLDSNTGRAKLVPKVLAQHHCNPPPKEESMSKWLNALRKRHAKQYASMQNEVKELELLKERAQGYSSSMESDTRREIEESRKQAEEEERQRLVKERMEIIQQRREELIDSLPEEPPTSSKNVITIALRFVSSPANANSSNVKRRFTDETPLGVIFNWIDAHFEIEREKISLSTMSGQVKQFTWEESQTVTLEEAGFRKMTGLRVSELIEDIDEPNSDDAES